MILKESIYKRALTAFVTAFIILNSFIFIGQYIIADQLDTMDYSEDVIFRKDGSHSFFYAERVNVSEVGYINISYIAADNELNFTVINLDFLAVDCYDLFNSVKEDVWYLPEDSYWYAQWINTLDEIIINFNNTDNITNFILFDIHVEPEQVLLDDVLIEDWEYENNNIYTSVPSGEHSIELLLEGREIDIPPETSESLYSHRYDLSAGWNMLSNPLNVNVSLDMFFTNEDIASICTRDDEGEYTTCIIKTGSNASIGYLESFYVFVSKDTSFTVHCNDTIQNYTIRNGWNFIGVPSNIPVCALPDGICMMTEKNGDIYNTFMCQNCQETILYKGQGYYMYTGFNNATIEF